MRDDAELIPKVAQQFVEHRVELRMMEARGVARVCFTSVVLRNHTLGPRTSKSAFRRSGMKGKLSALLLLPLLSPLTSFAREQLIPAGSLISCTVSEPRLSSKTTSIGDPVLCQVSHAERYGRSTIPFGSYMEGRFEDYKDPGHFVGKGWLELKFDRLIIQPDIIIPVAARVVAVPGYNVDREGRVLGKGHPVRDIVEWSIPILWPIDLINLPRRGPRPTLKEETRLTLKILDDIGVPVPDPYQQPQELPGGLLRRPSPSAYEPPPQPQPAPIEQSYAPPPPEYPAPPPVYYQQFVYVTPPPPPIQVRAFYPPPPAYYAPPVRVQAYYPGRPLYPPAAYLRRGPYGGPAY
jgi:hypothetical protein